MTDRPQLLLSYPGAVQRSILMSLVLMLGACSQMPVRDADGPPAQPVDVSNTPDAEPRHEPLSKYGNPPSYVVMGKTYVLLDSNKNYVERGIASWYGSKFHGRNTSSGEPYDMYAMTAAHKTLPIPTYAEVINLKNNKKVVVKINDRGPFKDQRLIDLSYAAAAKLGILAAGTGLVEVRTLNPSAATTPPQDTQVAPHLYLQVGAFSDPKNAEQLRHRLHGLAPVEINSNPPEPTQPTLYRVRVGPLPTVDVADRLAGTLKSMGIDVLRVQID